MEYDVVMASDMQSLIKEVNIYISQGWVPQGGVSMTDTPSFTFYLQAMVKNPKS